MPKLTFTFFGLLTAAICAAGNLGDITGALKTPRCLEADISYQVYLPTSADPVEYTIKILTGNKSDSLSPSDYLIIWDLPRGEKVLHGFNSYYDGNHFRYRDTRLQEYHFADSPEPFTSQGGGVQRTAQFTDLLPAFIADKLQDMDSDSTYIYNRKGNIITGVQRVMGYDAVEYTYEFDNATLLPVRIDFVFNPAGISEQTVTAVYNWKEVQDCPDFTEEYLMERFPEEFGKFRQSNFRAENLKGTAIPSFTYNNPEGTRISHTRGEADLSTPLLLVFLDNNVANVSEIVALSTGVTSSLPLLVSPVYAFADNDTPDGFGAAYVNGASGLIRKCGVTNYPTFILVNSDGTVGEVIIGMSTDISSLLEQSMILLK